MSFKPTALWGQTLKDILFSVDLNISAAKIALGLVLRRRRTVLCIYYTHPDLDLKPVIGSRFAVILGCDLEGI